MDIEDGHYYEINRKLVRMVGQWPFDNGRKSQFIEMFVIFCSWMGLLPQVINLVKNNIDKKHLLDILPLMVVAFAVAINSLIEHSMIGNVGHLFEQVEIDWKSPHTEEELKIKRKYAAFGSFITKTVAGYSFLLWLAIWVITLRNQILDIIIPLNESRVPDLYVELELFIDREKYYTYFFMYITVTFTVILLFMTAKITLNIVFLQHICGMFAVVCYRMQISLTEFKNDNGEIREKHNSLILCVYRHNKVLEFIQRYEDIYKNQILSVIGAMIVIAMIAYAEITEIKSFCLSLTVFFISYGAMYMGQSVTDMNTRFWVSTYDNYWYEHPKEIQQILLLLIMKSQKTRSLKVYSLISLCLEDFSKLARMTASYCMAIKSLK